MLELIIITVTCVAAIGFMTVFFIALCRDGNSRERCHVVRIDPEQSTTGAIISDSVRPIVAHGAVRRWALHPSEKSSRALKVVEIARHAEFLPLLKRRNQN